MLTYLNIKNFAIIQSSELDILPNMTVVTGETGAGKSLIVDTLEIVLGARTDSNIVRQGAEKCEITAIFDISKIKGVQEWINEHELDSNGECIIYRSISNDGRSRININNHPCTQQLVRELGSLLVNIHGQHEQQNLLKTDYQLGLLDTFANNANLLSKIKVIYNEWQLLQLELKNLNSISEDRNNKIELLTFQLKELNDLALKEGEWDELLKEHSMLTHAEDTIHNSNQALNIISNNENFDVLSYLNNAKGFIEKIKINDPKIPTILELINNSIIQAEEATIELKHFLNNIELNQERLEWIETRLKTINNLARKHKVNPEELPGVHTNLKEQLQKISDTETVLEQLQSKIQLLEDEYQKIATQISISRKTAAQNLSDFITKNIKLLGMPDGKFAIAFQPNTKNAPSLYGLERAEFQVTANLGHPLQALNKVASGGELSRISLAIQVILANKNTPATLIFDEVDVGIGGKTAEIVGQLLRKLSNNSQIICVTHLPQVAVCGHYHFRVDKSSSNDRTIIAVENLTNEKRVQEIARMLGGVHITELTLAHAKEMLKTAVTEGKLA